MDKATAHLPPSGSWARVPVPGRTCTDAAAPRAADHPLILQSLLFVVQQCWLLVQLIPHLLRLCYTNYCLVGFFEEPSAGSGI